MRRLTLAIATALIAAAPAQADWTGDGPGDVLAVNADGQLLSYAGTGSGLQAAQQVSGGWGGFTAVLAPGDFSGDGKPDLLARNGDGALLMYRGNGTGGWAGGVAQTIGAGWAPFTALVAPGDFSGDGYPDVLARHADGTLSMYRGDGDGGWITGRAEKIGTGWQPFSAIIPAGDFDGDGHADVLAVNDSALLLYRGNGAGGWGPKQGEVVGGGWAQFTALTGGGDFSGDGKPDVLARRPDGALLLYRGNGAGGWITGQGESVSAGWNGLTHLTLIPTTPPAPAPSAPEPVAPPAAPVPDGRVSLTAGIRCTPPGGLLRVSLKVRKRAGRPAPKVQRILFFVRNGPRRTDRRPPYSVRLRMHRPAGQKGRVYARVYFKRAGSKKLRTKTVSRRYVMCS
jgi:hypothetical protein